LPETDAIGSLPIYFWVLGQAIAGYVLICVNIFQAGAENASLASLSRGEIKLNSLVVPANAGTHTPRPMLLEKKADNY